MWPVVERLEGVNARMMLRGRTAVAGRAKHLAVALLLLAGCGLASPSSSVDRSPAAALSTPRESAEPSFLSLMTSDGARLDGVHRSGGARPDVGILLIHGLAGTFEGPPIGVLADLLAARGFSTLALNMRDAGCCTFTSLFEDNVSDIDAGVQFLKDSGATQIVLAGHSLGTNRVTYYRAQVGDPAVRALVLLAGVGNAHRVALAFDITGAGAQALAEAERRIAEDDGADDLLELPLGAIGTFYYTPWSLISNGGADTNSDQFRWLPHIDLPVLIVHATRDVLSAVQQPALAQEVAVGSPQADLVYVEGADHGFTQHAAELADILEAWIAHVLALP